MRVRNYSFVLLLSFQGRASQSQLFGRVVSRIALAVVPTRSGKSLADQLTVIQMRDRKAVGSCDRSPVLSSVRALVPAPSSQQRVRVPLAEFARASGKRVTMPVWQDDSEY